MEREWPAEALASPVSTIAGVWAMRRVHAPVTAEHLARGIPGSPTLCAVALALSDAGFTEPRVEWGKSSVKGLNGDTFTEPAVVEFGSDVIRYIVDFDEGRPVEPFDLWMGIGHS